MPTQFDLMKLRQQQQFGPSNPYFNPVQESGVGPPNPYFSPPPSDIGGYEDFSSPQRDYGHIDPFMVENGGERQYGQQMPNPSVPSVSQYGPAPEDPRNPNRIWDMINKIYTPETRSRDRVNTLLDNVPERQDPSFARRLVAAGMGFGQKDPIGTMENVMYSPHKNAMADWTAKTKPFQDAYVTENAANVNERNLAGNAVAAQAAGERADLQYRTAQEKQASAERIAEQKNATAEIRARAYAWKQMHPDWEWNTKGPTYVIKNPATGELIDTGLKTGQMAQEDEILLKQKGDIAVAQTNVAGRQGVANTNADLYQDAKGQFRLDARGEKVYVAGPSEGPATKVGTPGTDRPLSKSQMDAQEQAKYKEILRVHPEWRDLFKSTGTGTYTLRPRYISSEHMWDNEGDKKNMANYDQMMKEYYPNEVKGVGPSVAPAPSSATVKGSTNIFGGNVTPPAGFKGGTPSTLDPDTTPNAANAVSDPKAVQAEIENARKRAAGTDGNNTQTLPSGGQTDSHGYRYQRNVKTGEWSKSLDGINWIPAGAR